MTHLTSIIHSSSSSKEQSTSSLAADWSLHVTLFGRSAGLYNKNQNFVFFWLVSCKSLYYMFQAFLDVFSPVFFCFFCFANGLSNDEAFSYHSHQITTAEGNCHWDGLWEGIGMPWTAAGNSFSCKAEFGRQVQALRVMRYNHLHTICSGLAWQRAMF